MNQPTFDNFTQPLKTIGTQETLGVSTVKVVDKAISQTKPVDDRQPTSSGWSNLFGVMWYWWVLIGIVLLLIWWMFIG